MFGTELTRKGVDIVTVAELMGHVSLETTRLYTRPGTEDMQGRAGVQGEGDRRVAQAVRGELVPRADLGGSGQAADQFPQVALAEPPAAGPGPTQSPPPDTRDTVCPCWRGRDCRGDVGSARLLECWSCEVQPRKPGQFGRRGVWLAQESVFNSP